MGEQITISAKNLGALALPDFCPRCFWVKEHAKGLPYQIFPGIFNSIDAYGKKLVSGWFARHAQVPLWLGQLGLVKACIKPPHYTKFSVFDQASGVVLRGSPDGLLLMQDDSYVIVDYKTAKITNKQDELFPMYEVQLNAYAHIAMCTGFDPVSGLYLVYNEPETDDEIVSRDDRQSSSGFVLGFKACIKPVAVNDDLILDLLLRVRKIVDCANPPLSKEGCKDCELLRSLISLEKGVYAG